MFKLSAARAAAVAPFLALALVDSAAAQRATDICPDLVIDEATRNAAYYPGGAPGRNRADYSHIAVILSAEVACVETRDDQIIATVSVTYAVEPGPLYRGGANVKITAALTYNGSPISDAGNAWETPLTPGKPVTITNTIAGIHVGEDDDVKDGGFVLKVGLEP